jgi:hypothetical protein
MNPVDNPGFVQSDSVQEIIEATKAKVIIHEDSDDYGNLKAEDGKITGLTTGKYYRFEEYEGKDTLTFTRNRFLKSDGSHSGDLSDINRLNVGEIKDLKNFFTYKIIAAVPFANKTHDYFTFSASAKPASVTNGMITFVDQQDYFLDLTPGGISADKDYEVMSIPKTINWKDNFAHTSAFYTGTSGSIYGINNSYRKPAYMPLSAREIGIYQYRNAVTTGGSTNLKNKSIIFLPGTNASIEYDIIFAEYKDETVVNLAFIRIRRPTKTEINVTYVPPTDHSPKLDVQSGKTYPQDTTSITFNVTNAGDYNQPFEWYVDGIKQLGKTTARFTFDMTDIKYWVLGDYLITVIGFINGVPYSTVIKVTKVIS